MQVGRNGALRGVALGGLVLVLAACGGASKSASQGGNSIVGAAGTKGLAAAAMPAGSLLFADVNLDEGSPAWARLTALGSRFPSWPKFVADFQKSMNKKSDGSGLTGTQIRAMLGGEVGVAITAAPTTAAGQPSYLVYADVKDAAGIKAAIAKDSPAAGSHAGFDEFAAKDGKTVAGVGKDAMLVASTKADLEAAIDLRGVSSGRLTDSQEFKDALATLPSDNLMVGYVSTAGMQAYATYMEQKQAQTAGAAAALNPIGGVAAGAIGADQYSQIKKQLAAQKAIAFSFDATADGFRFRTTSRIDEAKAKELAGANYTAYKPVLLDRVPANSWLALSFQNLGPTLKTAYGAILDRPETKTKLTQFEALTGTKLDDLVALTSGEHALYVGPGLPASGALLLHPADATAGGETIKKLTALAAKTGKTPVTDVKGGQEIAVRPGFNAAWRQSGDVLGLGYGAGSTLADPAKDPLFKSAAVTDLAKLAGIDLTKDTTGEAYVNIGGLIAFGSAFKSPTDAKSIEALANAKHVGGMLAFGSRDGDLLTQDAFLEVVK